jgi:hypothetical protein
MAQIQVKTAFSMASAMWIEIPNGWFPAGKGYRSSARGP